MFTRQYDDDELVSAYLKYKSQIKAAEELCCSRETVARAVRRRGIPLNGRKSKGNGGGGSPRKISDEEVISESKISSAAEIAFRHGMHISNVDRKLKRLGIKACDGIGDGTGHYRQRVSEYKTEEYDTSVTLYRVFRKYHGICQICGQPVDCADINGRKAGDNYPTIDHIIPVSKGGPHTWQNVQLAHMSCNRAKGA